MEYFVWGSAQGDSSVVVKEGGKAAAVEAAVEAPVEAPVEAEEKTGGQLLELMKLLLNPISLISEGAEPGKKILGALLPASPSATASTANSASANGDDGTLGAAADSANSPVVSGKRVAMSSMHSMVLKAANNDPDFLIRVGLADRSGTIGPSSVGECCACGAPLIGNKVNQNPQNRSKRDTPPLPIQT